MYVARIMQEMQVTTAESAVNRMKAALPLDRSAQKEFPGGFRVRLSALTMNMVSAIRTIARLGMPYWQALSECHLAPDSYNRLCQ